MLKHEVHKIHMGSVAPDATGYRLERSVEGRMGELGLGLLVAQDARMRLMTDAGAVAADDVLHVARDAARATSRSEEAAVVAT